MCHKTSCSSCHKSTWMGCGNHIPRVMDSIPKENWCTCEPKVEKEGHQYPPGGSFMSTCELM
ncbi:hypothetical protein QBC35DRAFT_381259 [Podospora australis]|uniref:Uncharacterized protein n=1 Tax=Podospora australis TaxID=1536484 RepID=A0AAN6WVC2_9PEZI|nr:hypothetical protein QBC35DRAFT_381259 [Podospora australis]